MRCIPVIVLGVSCLVAEMFHSPLVAQMIPRKPDQWAFRDGERVALIGGTFIEREQRYGFLELALTAGNRDKSVTFRNLGWSGDTVGGVSRSGFDPPEAGFKQLVDQVNAVKPTLIVIGYGANEAFRGESGLDAFLKGMERLIDALKPTKARFILLAPLRQERLAPPLPDPSAHNRDIDLYSGAIADLASRTGADFVKLDPFQVQFRPKGVELTDNGIHLTALGYWALSLDLGIPFAQNLNYSDPDVARLKLVDSRPAIGHAYEFMSRLTDLEKTPKGVRFTFKTGLLPPPPPPTVGKKPSGARPLALPGRILTVEGLGEGRYRLEADGTPIASATSGEWSSGVAIPDSPTEIEQVERLRQAIIRKNELFFHRWRPQNITYLLGFRKHEQGNNAVEIPQFDPLVEEQEKKIAVLKKPVPHVYELIREESKGVAR